MFQNFRLAMAWVHTWFGLVLGFVLMAAFFFGALSVFDREIDRWSMPDTRFAPQPMPSFDRLLRPIFESMQPTGEAVEEMSDRVNGQMPARFETVNYWDAYTTHRDPVLGMYAGYELPDPKDPDELIYADRTIDPRTGKVFSAEQLALGSGFFYPMHFSLTWEWLELGYWLVGLAALVMLVALVSGVVVHRKLFREFFTFRPHKGVQRSTLDLHNLTGVVALPFHFFFAFTGLVIFAGTYFPIGHTQLEPLHDRHEQMDSMEGALPAHRAGMAAGLASVDAMMVEAQRRWHARGMAGEVGQLSLVHVGDINGYVSVYRAGTDRIALTSNGIHFRAATGELLREDPPVSAVGRVSEFLAGLHLQQFRHWPLRWLYFVGGIAGCTCIATGFLFFVTKRKRQHAKQASQGARVVDALAVTTVTGMIIATLGVLIFNRLLPDSVPSGWPDRGHLQYYGFWLAWLLAMAHAFWRTAPTAQGRLAPAWSEQCWMIAAMATAAVLLNWITTGDHLLRTLRNAYWPVAGVDLILLASAGIAVLTALKLRRAAIAASTSSSSAEEDVYA
jgi:uncharacterized iron-regulated membrane protein